MKQWIVLAVLLAGCASTSNPPHRDPQPPWAQRILDASDVAPAYEQAWRTAPNRATCLPVAPHNLGVKETVTARVAQFSGGWGVAYDLPGRRSAFGVAGTGSKAEGAFTYDWPYKKSWGSGAQLSVAGYGLEGGTGPNHLAYLKISGQDCLYNVWSALGREHLEHLLDQLRFVDMDPNEP